MDEIKKMAAGHSIEVLDAIMTEVEEARGEYESLDARFDEISGEGYSKAEADALLALKQNALNSTQLAAVNSGINSEKVAQIETNKNNISLILNGDGSIKPYTDIGRIGYSVETVVLSNVTISKSNTGMFYTSPINVSDKFDLLLGATLNNFQNLQSNIAIMPVVKPTDKTYTLWICDSTNPSTLPIAANMQIKVLLYGIIK